MIHKLKKTMNINKLCVMINLKILAEYRSLYS